jgi:hypothetical protein
LLTNFVWAKKMADGWELLVAAEEVRAAGNPGQPGQAWSRGVEAPLLQPCNSPEGREAPGAVVIIPGL